MYRHKNETRVCVFDRIERKRGGVGRPKLEAIHFSIKSMVYTMLYNTAMCVCMCVCVYVCVCVCVRVCVCV